MRLSLRFLIPLLLILAAFAYVAVPLVDKLTLDWFVHDLDSRATAVSNTIEEPVVDLAQSGSWDKMRSYFTRITEDERLYAMAFCPAKGPEIGTRQLPRMIRCDRLSLFTSPSGYLLRTADGPLLVSVRSLTGPGGSVGSLLVVHDMSFIERRSQET